MSEQEMKTTQPGSALPSHDNAPVERLPELSAEAPTEPGRAQESIVLPAELPPPVPEAAPPAEAADVPVEVMTHKHEPPPTDAVQLEAGPEPAENAEKDAHDANERVLAASRLHTRRSFLVAGVGAAGAVGFYEWLANGRREGDQPVLLRKSYQANAGLWRILFHDRGLAPTYSVSKAQTLRVNGVVSLGKQLELSSWRLQVVGVDKAASRPQYVPDVTAWQYKYAQPMPSGPMGAKSMAPAAEAAKQQTSGPFGRGKRGMAEAGESASTLYAGTPGLLVTMDALTRLPRQEFVTQFKCVEGWSQYVHWAGVRLADFLEEFPPQKVDGREPEYVYMETPDGDYYCGYTMLACRHPQSLLVTEMMGQPLTQPHGAPLRLHMPTKYGYKQIKRIGLIRYMTTKPDDYWTKLGYDWSAGL